MSRNGRVLYVLTALVALLVGGWLWLQDHQTQVIVGGVSYRLEVADTVEAHGRGLSGRTGLPERGGMLFVFDRPDVQCFWMKDMQFSLDMVWLDTHMRAVHIEHSVDPSTYPHSYCPNVLASYVLELNAGVANGRGVRVGDVLTFSGLE